MTNLSDLFPAGAGKQVSFTAAETIGAGKIVQVKTDGQIELPQATGDLTGQVGTGGYIDENTANFWAMDYNPVEDKYVGFFVAASGTIEGMIGTASGLDISWSGVGGVISGTTAQGVVCRYMPAFDKFVLAFRDQGSSNYLSCCYGTMASGGGSISVSSKGSLSTAVSMDFSAAEHAGVGIPVVQYQDSSGYPHVVGLIDGSAPTYGTPLALTSSVAAYYGRYALVYDPDRARLISTYAISSGIYAVEIDVTSGSVVSKGTTSSELKTTANADETNLAYDTVNDKMLYAFKDSANSNYGTCFVLSNSSGTFSAGTSVVFNSGNTEAISPAYATTNGVIILAFYDAGTTKIEGTGVTISGTTVNSWTPVTLDAFYGQSVNAVYDPDTTKVYVGYSADLDTSARDVGLTPGGYSVADYIGVSEASISSAASGNVTLKGGILTSGVSGLTPGVDYYGQSDGSISTTSTSPAVKIGKAMSATSINLEYQS